MRAFAQGRSVVAVLALVVLGGQAVPAQAAEGEVVKSAGAEIVEGRYIVSLRPGVHTTSGADAVVARHGGRVEKVYGAALNGFLLSATERQARRLAADPRVERVEADAVVHGTGVRENPIWNLDRIDQRSTVLDSAYEYPEPGGQGVTVYVMDTGVRTTHEEFQGRASLGYDAIKDGRPTPNGDDCSTSGHGTHVAATIGGATFGVAPKVSIKSVRVLSCENSGTVSQIIDGVNWVTAETARPAVVNMSLGGSSSTLENDAIKRSIASGITYVVAAGNRDSNACSYSPASVPEAVTVGASNPVEERATGWKGTGLDTGSNYGSCLDLFAPGESIKSAHNATDQATVVLRGTSMASPHVAGAAALLLSQSPASTPAQIAKALTDRSTPNILKASTLGTGSPNKFLYTGPLAVPVCTVSNDARQPVPDLASVESVIEVTSCGRKVATTAKVRVRAQHPFRGDLSVTLKAPNGTEVALKNADAGDQAVDLDQEYPLSLSTLDANGTWRLVVRDNFGLDEGALLGWTLSL